MTHSSYTYLAFAIGFEIVATSALNASAGFTRLVPTAVALGGYLAAFYLLSLALVTIPVGIAYAIWSGVGIVILSIVARILYGQKLDGAAITGMAMIVIGVMIIKLWSKTAGT